MEQIKILLTRCGLLKPGLNPLGLSPTIQNSRYTEPTFIGKQSIFSCFNFQSNFAMIFTIPFHTAEK
jgi:hypothetical protein